MLTKPKAGWTDFSLSGTSVYSLSYLDDIAFEWIEQAIHGLDVLLPFCVKGFLEPGRMLCTVSYWNCHIILERDGRSPLEKREISLDYSHTSMLDFCRSLYDDISSHVDDWASFVDYNEYDIGEKRKELLRKLEILQKLIFEKTVYFGEDRCFL